MPLKSILRVAAVATVAACLSAGASMAQDMQFFRIATGGTAGHLFPDRRADRQRDLQSAGFARLRRGRQLRRAGLVATAVASNGSVANVNGIAGGTLESGFSQSDVAYWAHSGTGIFEGKGAVEKMRAIANLYPEASTWSPRKSAGIDSRRRSEGQEGVARRAGLRHAGRRAHHPGGLRPRRGRRGGRVPQAQPGGRSACATARWTPSSSSAAFRPAPSPSSPPACEIALVPITGAEAEGIARGVRLLRRARHPGRHLRGRPGRHEDAFGRRAVGDQRRSSRTI